MRPWLASDASDLNPVAVTINQAMIEIPPLLAGRKPVDGSAGTGSAGVPPANNPPATSPPATSPPGKNWYSRGYLPHFDQPDLLQSITFRLADALPASVVEQLRQSESNEARFREKLEAYLNAGHGECLLREPAHARIVEDALLHFDGERYRLLAWVIMPNHVHVLIETQAGRPLPEVIHSWKSFSAKAINHRLKRQGVLWQREYFERYIRDDRHLRAVIDYIENNPVKAGLAKTAADWPFGGARRGVGAGGTPALPGFEDGSGARGRAEDARR